VRQTDDLVRLGDPAHRLVYHELRMTGFAAAG
jgi:hypothetical protein